MVSADSPYPLGTPVVEPRLLQNRRIEIATALEAVAPARGTSDRHAVVLGEQRSGGSTVMLEVARRAAAERGRLVVWLRGADDISCSWQRLTRHLVTATVEALAGATAAAPWYLAWRDRVYLRNSSPSRERDLLSSALALAVDREAEIDRAVLERDLEALLRLAREAGLTGIVVCIDDASSLTEDVALVEELLGMFDAVGDYGLLLAGLPVTAEHFVQAASPCLARVMPVWLHPFRGTQQVFTSLSAPLTGPARDWLHADDAAFVLDVLRLTGGRPYELMLVGHHLWLTCQRGEQDRYALTPRVLDRIIPHLSLLASGGDDLLDGAQAIDRLPEEHVRQAVDLVALSRLTLRQIAIARVLEIGRDDADHVDSSILTANLDEETERVLTEVEELQATGVIQVHADRKGFSVVGGQRASVLLKYKARARIGAEISSQPFELDFIGTVGRALARDAARRTRDSLEGGAAALGSSSLVSEEGAGRLSPRPAIRRLNTSSGLERLVAAEIDIVPVSVRQFERIAELLTEEDPAVALVYTSLTHGREQLEYTELWEVPRSVAQEDVARAWAAIIEDWEPVVSTADLEWSGSEFAVLRGEMARQALIVMQRYAATSAVHRLFDRWYAGRDDRTLARAQEIGDEAVATMRATGMSEWELGGELSGMLSRVGFLKSFSEETLDQARTALIDALRIGSADTWVTKWNLANVAARQGDSADAMTQLEEVGHLIADWRGQAFVLTFIPGRPPVDCLVKVTDVGIAALLELQRAVVRVSRGDDVDLSEAIARCRASDDDGPARAAGWVEGSLTMMA